LNHEQIKKILFIGIMAVSVGSLPGYFALFPDEPIFYAIILSIQAGNFILLQTGYQALFRRECSLAVVCLFPVAFLGSLNFVLTVSYIYYEFFYR